MKTGINASKRDRRGNILSTTCFRVNFICNFAVIEVLLYVIFSIWQNKLQRKSCILKELARQLNTYIHTYIWVLCGHDN